jgi:hypothetical protein
MISNHPSPCFDRVCLTAGDYGIPGGRFHQSMQRGVIRIVVADHFIIAL